MSAIGEMLLIILAVAALVGLGMYIHATAPGRRRQVAMSNGGDGACGSAYDSGCDSGGSDGGCGGGDGD